MQLIASVAVVLLGAERRLIERFIVKLSLGHFSTLLYCFVLFTELTPIEVIVLLSHFGAHSIPKRKTGDEKAIM